MSKRKGHGSSLALAIFSVSAVPSPARADASMAGSDANQPHEEVLIRATAMHQEALGGKLPANLLDLPQSVTVIDREVLRAQAATSLERALLNVPGITLGSAEGGQIGNNINLRGFTARTDIYVDGFRDRGQYYRDTYYLESVEVLKGPSSMLFGRGSTGGVINQTRRAPELYNEHQISAIVGDDYYRAVGNFNQQLTDSSAARIDLMGQRTSSTRDVMENRDVGVAPSVSFGVGTPTLLTLDGLYQHNDDMPDYGVPAVNRRTAPVDPDNFYGLIDDHTLQNVKSIAAKVKHNFNDHLVLRNQAQYTAYDIDARETALGSVGVLNGGVFTALTTANGNTTTVPLSGLSVRLISHDRQIEDRSFDNQTDVLASFNTGAIGQTLMVGGELGRDTYDNQARSRNNLPIVALLQPAHLASPSNSVTTYGNDAQTTAKTYAVYANDTMSLGRYWKLVAGARWDRFDATITNSINRNNTPGNTAVPNATQAVHFTSVRSGVLFQPTHGQSYYVSYGTSFNPSLETLTLTTGTQNLDPEKNRSYEVGAKWDLAEGKLSMSWAAFQVEKTNARSQVSTGVYELDGDVRVRGGEFGLTGRLTDYWQVMAGFAHLDAKIVAASALEGTQGKVPANTPRDTASVWTTFNVTPTWQVGGGANYMSNRFANNTDVVAVGSYLRIDATLAFLQPSYEVRVNVQNVANRRDVVATIQSDGGRSVPEIGRTALLTVAYRF